MRFIDNKGLAPPDGWEQDAQAATDAVVNDNKDVNGFGTVWRSLKDKLADVSHDKCWYCEVKQQRSDNAVDHFRPKALYKWLAFRLDNFRYSCTYCNSRRTDPTTGVVGGKGDSFPLADGSVRATTIAELAQEHPLLLNPCNPHDPTLLDFNEDGRPVARFPTHVTRRLRADTSIRLYNLDHTDLVESRRVLAVELNEKIEAANDLYERVDDGDAAVLQSYNSHVRYLKNAMAERAELSVFARKVIAGRRDLPWVDVLFLI